MSDTVTVSGLDAVTVARGAVVVLAAANAIILLVADARFRRNRLILD